MAEVSQAVWGALEDVLRQDPGGRGIAAFFLPGELAGAARLLDGAPRVAITSGFPVLGSEVAETDGPPGALALGEALTALGSEVVYFTDPRSAPLFQALGARPLQVMTLAQAAPAERAAAAHDLLARLGATHLVAIERPGRAPDGRYRNMAGRDITHLTSGLDELFLVAPQRGVHTVGIGDGGNEVGLGSVRERVVGAVPHGEEIATVVATERTVVAGVSTWGAWALVAALGLRRGRDLLPDDARVAAQLEALVAAGALDGVTKRPEATLDGLPLELTWRTLAALRQAGSAAPDVALG